MSDLFAALVVFGGTTGLAERIAARDRTQESPGTFLAARAASALVGVPLLVAIAGPPWASALLFWSGAELCWLVIRLHLESSITLALLRELAVRGPTGERALREALERDHGVAARLEALARGGFVTREDGVSRHTPRGRRLARAVVALGGG